MYAIRAADFFASYTDSLIKFNDVALLPLFSKKEFAKEKGSQTDRIKINAEEITINNIDVKSFL